MGAALACVVLGGALVAVAAAPASAATPTVLDMNGSTVSGQPYTGTQPQSFNFVKQSDGSFGIRQMYSGLVLDMNGSTVSGQPYVGTQQQSFQVVQQSDGSWGIRAFYGGDRASQVPRARTDAATTTIGTSVTVGPAAAPATLRRPSK